MVVNVQNMWGVDFLAYGRRTYILRGFLTKQAAEAYVNLNSRNIVGERKFVKASKYE